MKIMLSFVLFMQIALCSAHDYYILPELFVLKKGDALKAHLYVGDEFKIEEERRFQKYITLRYDWRQNGQTIDLMHDSIDGILW